MPTHHHITTSGPAAYVPAEEDVARTRPIRPDASLPYRSSPLRERRSGRHTLRLVPREPQSAAAARRLVAQELTDWGLAQAIPDAQLLVSELVANAVRHTTCRRIAVAVRLEGRTVRVAVRDAAGSLPVVTSSGTTATSGRGMALVEAIADRWGIERAGRGKWVWAECRF